MYNTITASTAVVMENFKLCESTYGRQRAECNPSSAIQVATRTTFSFDAGAGASSATASGPGESNATGSLVDTGGELRTVVSFEAGGDESNAIGSLLGTGAPSAMAPFPELGTSATPTADAGVLSPKL